MSPKVNEAAKIAKIHYIYQQRPNEERADNFAKRKLYNSFLYRKSNKAA